MATTDTGPIGTLGFVSAAAVDPDGTGENWLRIRYSLDSTGATEALVGFKYWHDDEAGSTTPVWVDATDAVSVGGDGADPQVYEVLVPVPLDAAGVATWHETVEEYPLGIPAVGSMDKGGAGWNGPWLMWEFRVGYVGNIDDFEDYPLGAVGTLNGGDGWVGAWVFTEY